MVDAALRLRRLPLPARLALSCLVLVILGGYAASGLYMREHHGKRDGRPGLTTTDIEGAYHGVTVEPRLRGLLEGGHPTEVEGEPIDPIVVQELTAWLEGDQLAENWANIDFGEGYGSPQELTAESCGTCHGPQLPQEERAEPLLVTWDHYQELVQENRVLPTDADILLLSTHTHAIALGTISLLVCALMYGTRWPGGLKGLLALLASAGLLVDLAAWWLARDSAAFVSLIVAGGVAHAGAMGLMMLAVLLDLWLPGQGPSGTSSGAASTG